MPTTAVTAGASGCCRAACWRGGGGLRPPAEGKAVRVRRRQLLLSDGPFAETKEQVGGFCMIEAADMDEAVAVAAEHPAATYGTIEVRELWPPL